MITNRNPKPRFEIALTYAGILVTLVCTVFFFQDVFANLLAEIRTSDFLGMLHQVVFIVIVTLIIWGNYLYQFMRIGYYRRLRTDLLPGKRRHFDSRFLANGSEPLTMLIPSYKEEPRVVMMTLYSAALQTYPNKRVVLLLDDPPFPNKGDDRALLREVRSLPGEISARIASHLGSLEGFREAFAGEESLLKRRKALADAYSFTSEWYEEEARHFDAQNHVERFFVEQIFQLPAKRFRKRSAQLMRNAGSSARAVSATKLLEEFERLRAVFRVSLEHFERKKYLNLSHEPNKAMNLNAYISLIGGHYDIEKTERGNLLHKTDASSAALSVPRAEYLVNLDADSLLFPEYAETLVGILLKKGNERTAVIQTPYSSFPGAGNELERLAGATTDIQYIIHQGFTYYRATYWVGANALMRKQALEDISVTEEERGYPVKRYIQDRTVIEDTESSIDLVAKGWKLFNYPERLSYSATPPDFGSLLIQRRRWANGGLIIFPKLVFYFLRNLFQRRIFSEFIVRSHYLLSIAIVNIGLLIIILVPFENSMQSWWLPGASFFYFFFYYRDLRICGYKPLDLFRVYALNMMLLPVNIGGVLKSVQQMVTRQKIPFARTPKREGRTPAPLLYIAAEFLLMFYCLFAFVMDVWQGRYAHAGFSLFNFLMFLYVFHTLLGWRNGLTDLFSFTDRKTGFLLYGGRSALQYTKPLLLFVGLPFCLVFAVYAVAHVG